MRIPRDLEQGKTLFPVAVELLITLAGIPAAVPLSAGACHGPLGVAVAGIIFISYQRARPLRAQYLLWATSSIFNI